jgi:aminomethyltransferase
MTAFGTFLQASCGEMLPVAAGITTPRRFSDPAQEHLATRRTAGLFDFSFMCCAEITGPASAAFLHRLQTRALDHLQRGAIAYTLLLRSDGSVLNDATVWAFGGGHYWLFAGRLNDFAHIADCARDFDVNVTDLSAQHAVIALQGPASKRIIERCLLLAQPLQLPYYRFIPLVFAGIECRLARIGYSGESGYEFILPDCAAPTLWQALIAAGQPGDVVECGFDATDSLRIEAGHLLFTQELAARVTPSELGLTRLVDLYANDFIGARALLAQRRLPLQRRLSGLLPAARSVRTTETPARLARGTGVLTSVCWSPVLERTLGIGFVNPEDAYPGTAVALADGTRARIARLPFYDPCKMLPRQAQ